MSAILTLALFAAYLALACTRPRLGAALATVAITWAGWRDVAHGSPHTIFWAIWCLLLYAGTPLIMARSMSPNRMETT